MKRIPPFRSVAITILLFSSLCLMESARAADRVLVEITPNQDIGTDPANLLPDPQYSPVKLSGVHQQAVAAHEQGVDAWESLAPGFVNVPVNMVLRGDTITLGIDIGGLMQSTDGGATWRNISYGVEGGFNTQQIVDFDVSPTNSALMLIAGRGGIYRTGDGGIHWEAITQGLPRRQFQNWSIWYGQIKFNADSSRVFSAIGSLWHYDSKTLPASVKTAHPTKEVYVSRDGGKTFKTYEISGESISSVKRIYPHPSNPEIVYFSFKDGTFLATFNALSDSIEFEKIPLPAGYFVRDMTIDPLDSTYMALALSSTTGAAPLVYTSTNCTSLTMSIAVAPKPSGLVNDIISIAFNPQRPTQLIIGERQNNALWVSENRGSTYAKVDVPSSLLHGSLTAFYGAAETVYTGSSSDFAVVASKVGAWITRDNFATFQDLTMTYDGTYFGNRGVGTPANINSIAMCSNAVYFSAQDHGVFRSKGNDLTLWEDLTGTDNWYKFPQQDVPWGTYTWMHKPEKVFAAKDESCVIFNALKYLSPDTGFRVEKKFFRTRNQGVSWDDITAGFGFGDIFPSGNQIVKMLFNPSDSDEIWALFTDELYHSTDGGDSFQPVTSPLFPTFGSLQASFSDIAMDSVHNILYLSVGNSEGTFSQVLSLTSSPAAMYKSTDGGQTWTIFNSGQYSVKSVAVAGNGSVVVGGSVAGGQPAQLVTIPYGQSYQASQVKLTLGDTVEEIATCQLQFSPISVDGPYVLAYANKNWIFSDERNPQGPYLSKDYGETFEFIQYDLPQKFIWSLAMQHEKVLLGTTFGLMGYDIVAPSVPGRVAGLSATVSGELVALSWTPVLYATSYTVRRAPSAGGLFEVLQSGVGAISYVDTSAVLGQTYYYTVSATNSAGEGSASVAVSARVSVGVLAGWDKGVHSWISNRSADVKKADVTASVAFSANSGSISGDWNNQSAGSRDGTFGTFSGARTTNPDNAALEAANAKFAGVYADYTITNTGTQDYELSTFHFDAWRSYNNQGQVKAEVLAGGGITAGDLSAPTLVSRNGFPPSSTADYDDIDLSLSGLVDHTLAAGESVTFRIGVITASGINIDNVALTGGILSGYDQWARGWGGVDIGSETNDFDQDGLLNIFEYGLNGDPTNAADRGEAPFFAIVDADGSNLVSYVYPQLKDPDSGLVYFLELSTNLVSGVWTNGGYAVVGTNIVASGVLDYVSNTTTMVEDEKYIRLKIKGQ